MPHIETINGVPIEPAEVIDARTAYDSTTYDSLGDLLRELLGNLYTELDALKQGGYVPDEELIGSMIDQWLLEHPEYMTTVEDHSITYEKLAPSLVETITVTPMSYGDIDDAIEVANA